MKRNIGGLTIALWMLLTTWVFVAVVELLF
jgi:hypothetical protein